MVDSQRESALLQLGRADETFVAVLRALDKQPELLRAPAREVCSSVREVLPTAKDLRIMAALDLLLWPIRATRGAGFTH